MNNSIKLAVILALLTLLVLLVACGGQPTVDEAEPATEETSKGEAEEATVATQTITDDLGRTVEIPANPQRVVFNGEEHAAMVTSLGYVPYAMSWGYHADFIDTLEGIGGDVGDLSTIIDLGDSSQINIETVAAVNPDLILTWDDPESVELLEEIAPTLGLNPRFNRTGGYDEIDAPPGPRYAKQRIFASLVGVEDELEAQIAQYEALLADIKERHREIISEMEWTFLDTGDDFQPHMYDDEKLITFAYNAVMTDLGMTPSAAMDEATETNLGFDEDYGYAQISLEVAPDFVADLLFIGRYDDAPLDDQLLTVLSNTAPAQNDQIYRVDSNVWTYHLVQAEIDILRQVDEILSGGVENLGDFD